MNALISEAPGTPIIADIPMPAIKDTEVLIKPRTVGICQSDHERLVGRFLIPISYSVAPGHEWCGEIVEVGKSVEKLNKDDRVVGKCVVCIDLSPNQVHEFALTVDVQCLKLGRDPNACVDACISVTQSTKVLN